MQNALRRVIPERERELAAIEALADDGRGGGEDVSAIDAVSAMRRGELGRVRELAA
jgi:hypothetical protein